MIKKLVGQLRLVKALSLGALAAALAVQAVPVFAQDTLAEARLRKMEAHIRALQRVVFPGPNGKIFRPEITQEKSTAGVGQPATSAVTDLLARMEALEAQIARLTGQIEQNTHRIAQLEARGEAPGSPAAPALPGADPATPAPQSNLDAMSGGASLQPAAVIAPSDDRLAAVRAIVKPQTADAGEDEYNYGFRLWDAKFYPEAQQQLKLFVEEYPEHSLISYGRNLLGRAYLDGGKPREAAQWLLLNYTTDKSGGRAPDSLLYLAVAMKELKDTKRACIALAEFAKNYTAEATGRLKSTYDAVRDGLECG